MAFKAAAKKKHAVSTTFTKSPAAHTHTQTLLPTTQTLLPTAQTQMLLLTVTASTSTPSAASDSEPSPASNSPKEEEDLTRGLETMSLDSPVPSSEKQPQDVVSPKVPTLAFTNEDAVDCTDDDDAVGALLDESVTTAPGSATEERRRRRSRRRTRVQILQDDHRALFSPAHGSYEVEVVTRRGESRTARRSLRLSRGPTPPDEADAGDGGAQGDVAPPSPF
jgi:hypothetical protein